MCDVLYFSFACAGDLQAPVGNYQLRRAIWLVVHCPFSSVEIGFKSGFGTGLGWCRVTAGGVGFVWW